MTRAENLGEGDWEASFTSYTWDPDGLRFLTEGAGSGPLHSPEDDAEIASYTDWDC